MIASDAADVILAGLGQWCMGHPFMAEAALDELKRRRDAARTRKGDDGAGYDYDLARDVLWALLDVAKNGEDGFTDCRLRRARWALELLPEKHREAALGTLVLCSYVFGRRLQAADAKAFERGDYWKCLLKAIERDARHGTASDPRVSVRLPSWQPAGCPAASGEPFATGPRRPCDRPLQPSIRRLPPPGGW
jgi:hypothetical protein